MRAAVKAMVHVGNQSFSVVGQDKNILSGVFSEIKLVEDFLMFKNSKSEEVSKKVGFEEDVLSLSKFIENRDCVEIIEFLFKVNVFDNRKSKFDRRKYV